MSEKIRIIVFGTEKCGHCKALYKGLEASKSSGDFSLEYRNCMEEMEYARELGIRSSIPFTVVFHNADVVSKYTGNRLTEIETCIESLMT
jgi:thioredoxin-like negative regulator of GroEL